MGSDLCDLCRLAGFEYELDGGDYRCDVDLPADGAYHGVRPGTGISDFDLIKRSFRNFATATVFSVITSTLFFLISPISEAQSELLARTQPTVYDVLIAFFGGLAGIVASSTKSKGNVIPGVAIATALMPPLCTAGFGLASGNLYYFFGAFYLYFINTVFISLATYVVVRLLKYPKKVFLNKQREKIVTRYVGGDRFLYHRAEPFPELQPDPGQLLQ